MPSTKIHPPPAFHCFNKRGFNEKTPVGLALGLTIWMAAGLTWSGSLPTAKPEDVGLSSKKLDVIGAMIQGDVEKDKIPGGVLLVARHGKVAYFKSFGFSDADTKRSMPKDAIFRIYSMSKPIAQVAAMMLVEQGKIGLDDPVSKYLPAFASMKVGIEKPGKKGGKPFLKLVKAKRSITIRDLMRHTSGIGYGFLGQGLARASYDEPAYFRNFDISNADFADKVAKLPLLYQPGTTWAYGHSTDVLARVVEVVSGKSLYQFEKENLLDPLDMKDTAFYVKDSGKFDRIAEPLKEDAVMSVDPNGGKQVDGSPFLYTLFDPRTPHKCESAGSGMVSTAMDYARFLQMLLDGGALDGKRYLKPETVTEMTTDEISQGFAHDSIYLPGPGNGFGLGFAVREPGNLSPLPGTEGDYFWFGAAGTLFWVDPKKDMLVVYMMQSPKQWLTYVAAIRQLVYASMLN